MTALIQGLITVLLGTLRDIAPITVIILLFQLLVIRQPFPHLRKLITGYGYVILGLALFLMGLERALFPLGTLMAEQLTAPEFLSGGVVGVELTWRDYYWVYLFAACVGFATTLAEPALIAVALMARDVSGGAISPLGLRLSVSIGVALGIALGTLRIVLGWPLHYFIISGYVIVLLQTMVAPKLIIGLAYDSGGVTTSTVTVPLVTALGLGLAANVPGRNPLMDGFGLIAFASLFPIITVLGYAQFAELRSKYSKSSEGE